jgi:hypothetical protein
VTVAVFDLPPLAHVARDRLEEAGIKAIVADDQMVGMDWLLSTAIGGVKVQVWEEDADRALTVLEEGAEEPAGEQSDHPAPPTEESDGYEPTEEDFAAEPEARVESAAPPDPDGRDRLARRALFVGWIGLALCPVTAYAFYVCLNATFGPGEISDRGRFELAVAWVTVLLGVFFSSVFGYFVIGN